MYGGHGDIAKIGWLDHMSIPLYLLKMGYVPKIVSSMLEKGSHELPNLQTSAQTGLMRPRYACFSAGGFSRIRVQKGAKSRFDLKAGADENQMGAFLH